MPFIKRHDATDIEVQGPDEAPAKRRRIRRREWSGALLGLGFGAAGLVGGRLGQLYPAFDVFAQFSVQFLAIVFAFIIAFFTPRFKALTGIALTIILLAVYSSWPHYVSDPLQNGPFKLEQNEKTLRLAHFNVFVRNHDQAAIEAEIRRLNADVITLVEFEDSNAAVLFKLKDLYPFQVDCHDKPACEMAILSKIPIKSYSAQGIWVGPPYISATLAGAFDGVTVYGVHTTRFPRSRAQLKQAQELVKKMEQTPGRVVAMGDYNATPYSRITRTIEAGAGLHRVTELPTWPATWGWPQLAIDHVFLSEGMRVVGNQQIGNRAGSDHYPILVTIAVRPL